MSVIPQMSVIHGRAESHSLPLFFAATKGSVLSSLAAAPKLTFAR